MMGGKSLLSNAFAILIGVSAVGNIVIQSLPEELEAYDNA